MRPMFRLTWALPIILACAGFSSGTNLTVLYQWKYIDYVWNDEAQKAAAIESGQYNYTKIITNDVQQLPDGRVLVTTPKYYDNPASLSVISDEKGEGGPLLKPYPDWSYHEKAGDCSEITSVNRMRVDKCNRLWAVDSGKIGNEQVCPATILVFDAIKDELLLKIQLADELVHNPIDPSKGKLEIQAVETVGDNCEETWAYIGDPEGSGLVIYDGSRVWRLDDNVYAPKVEESIFSIAGENITLENGVSSLVLPPPGFMEQDYLLFKPMASLHGYAATREQLHNSHLGIGVTYYMSNYTIPSQELARDYSSDGVLIAGLPTQTAIACWYLGNPLVDPYVEILETNAENLQFISGLKITKGMQSEVEGEHLWVMSNRFQQFISGTMNFTVDNFYILGANVATLVNGTHCQPESPSIVNTIQDKFFFEL